MGARQSHRHFVIKACTFRGMNPDSRMRIQKNASPLIHITDQRKRLVITAAEGMELGQCGLMFGVCHAIAASGLEPVHDRAETIRLMTK